MTDTVSLIEKLEAEAFNPTYDNRMGKWIPLLRAKEIITQHEAEQNIQTAPVSIHQSSETIQTVDDLYSDSVIQDIEKTHPPIYLSKGDLDFSTAFRLVQYGSYIILGREGEIK